MLNIDKEEFERNLLLTQAYCELQLQKPFTNNFDVLRSFNPTYNGEPIFINKRGRKANAAWRPSGWNICPHFDDELLFDKVFEQQIVFKNDIDADILPIDKYEGKLLVAEIDSSTCDGASADESDDFIDGYDCPPIDTWVYITVGKYGRILLAWIPEPYVEIVNDAIDVNPLNSFYWYDNRIL